MPDDVKLTVVDVPHPRTCHLCSASLTPLGKRSNDPRGGFLWDNEGNGWHWCVVPVGDDGVFPRGVMALYADAQRVRICSPCNASAPGVVAWHGQRDPGRVSGNLRSTCDGALRKLPNARRAVSGSGRCPGRARERDRGAMT